MFSLSSRAKQSLWAWWRNSEATFLEAFPQRSIPTQDPIWIPFFLHGLWPLGFDPRDFRSVPPAQPCIFSMRCPVLYKPDVQALVTFPPSEFSCKHIRKIRQNWAINEWGQSSNLPHVEARGGLGKVFSKAREWSADGSRGYNFIDSATFIISESCSPLCLTSKPSNHGFTPNKDAAASLKKKKGLDPKNTYDTSPSSWPPLGVRKMSLRRALANIGKETESCSRGYQVTAHKYRVRRKAVEDWHAWRVCPTRGQGSNPIMGSRNWGKGLTSLGTEAATSTAKLDEMGEVTSFPSAWLRLKNICSVGSFAIGWEANLEYSLLSLINTTKGFLLKLA